MSTVSPCLAVVHRGCSDCSWWLPAASPAAGAVDAGQVVGQQLNTILHEQRQSAATVHGTYCWLQLAVSTAPLVTARHLPLTGLCPWVRALVCYTVLLSEQSPTTQNAGPTGWHSRSLTASNINRLIGRQRYGSGCLRVVTETTSGVMPVLLMG